MRFQEDWHKPSGTSPPQEEIEKLQMQRRLSLQGEPGEEGEKKHMYSESMSARKCRMQQQFRTALLQKVRRISQRF
jgi:hypothetical protein